MYWFNQCLLSMVVYVYKRMRSRRRTAIRWNPATLHIGKIRWETALVWGFGTL